MRDRRQIEDRRERRHAADVVPDARDEEWYQFTVAIEALIASGEKRWAEPLLRRIQQRVDATHWVTQGERNAVRAVQQARAPMHDWARKWPWPID